MRTVIILGIATVLLLLACAQPLKVNYRTECTRQGDFYTIDIRMPMFPKENPVGALANKEVKSIVKQFKIEFLKTMTENRNNKYLRHDARTVPATDTPHDCYGSRRFD